MIRHTLTLPVILTLLAMATLLPACSKIKMAMQIETGTAGDILKNSASVTGIIIDIGEGAQQHGHCYGTQADVTVDGTRTQLGAPTAAGQFSSELTGLEPETTYFVKAYISGTDGTIYGDEISFTTLEDDAPGTFIDNRDGRVYARIKIGDAWWMAENLAWLPSVNSSVQTSETTPYYYVHSFSGTLTEARASSYYNTYGTLYNYAAAVNACPTGWHLPTDAEWTTMENLLIAGGYNFDGSTTGNKLAKAMAYISGWDESFVAGSAGSNDYIPKKNAAGFNALPGGLLIVDGGGAASDGLGMIGYWWSASEATAPNIWTRYISYEGVSINRIANQTKAYALSIRCVRDN